MSRPHSILLALVAASLVVTGALIWFAWSLIDRERELERQRVRGQADSAADAVAAAVRSRLADAGDRLSAWLSDADLPPPAIENAAVLGVRPGAVAVTPAGALPFIPFWPTPAPASTVFAAAETLEFAGGEIERAAEQYRFLANHPSPLVRAGAWFRLGRALMRAGDHRGALRAYTALTAMGAMNVDGLPAELHGLNGQHRIYQVRRDEANAARAADRIVSGIDSGRWLLSRGQAAHHREALTSKPYPPSWRLAHALAEVWAEQEDGPSARGHRLVDADGEPVVVLWRSGRAGVAALAAPMRAFFAAAAPQAVVWTLTPAAASDTAALPGALTRVIAAADEDWILSVSAPAAPSAARSRERLIAGTVAAAAGFIWVAVLFIARAVRKEAAVARMQADFVAAVSHEFRTPVTAVRQISEMLEMGRPEGPARVQQYYSVLVTESLRLQRLVETLLNFGRMEAGARRYELVETPIEPIIRGAVADVAALVSQSGTSVDVTGTDEPVLIDADADALRLALRNLLENAIKYSPGRPTVSIRWRVERRRAVIEVADRGLGIGAAEQRAIFRKFVRGRAAVQARVKGTGVGLAVVQHIVHAHGGELSVVSEPGQGSTFTIALPPDQVGQASSD